MTTPIADTCHASDPKGEQDHRLPLHPRKAQALFHELVSIYPHARQDTTEKPMTKRIQSIQSFYRVGMTELKRGRWFQLHDPEGTFTQDLVHVRLSASGEFLSLQHYNDSVEENQSFQFHETKQKIPLSSVERLTVFPNLLFVLHIRSSMEEEIQQPQDTRLLGFEAENQQVFQQWIINLALCHKTLNTTIQERSTLVDHGLQLRTVELSQSIGIRKALQIMECAYTQLYEREKDEIILPSPLFVFQWLTTSPLTADETQETGTEE